MRVLRPNHSATPARPPSAAEVIGNAMPWIPASTKRTLTGRSQAVTPVSSCGASRVSVAAAVKQIAPHAPITNPSNDSRVPGRTNRITTAGISMSTAATIGIANTDNELRTVC